MRGGNGIAVREEFAEKYSNAMKAAAKENQDIERIDNARKLHEHPATNKDGSRAIEGDINGHKYRKSQIPSAQVPYYPVDSVKGNLPVADYNDGHTPTKVIKPHDGRFNDGVYHPKPTKPKEVWSNASDVLTPMTETAVIDPKVAEQNQAILGYIKADSQILDVLAKQGIKTEEQLALVASYATHQNYATGNRKVTDMDCDPATGRLAVVVDHRLIRGDSDAVIFSPQQALKTDLTANLTQAPEALQANNVAQAQDVAQFTQQQAVVNQSTTGPVMSMNMATPTGDA